MSKVFSVIKEALSGKEHDLTKISIDKAIVLLSVPMVLEMMMESLFALVDIYFVSQVSVNAVTTVGLTESVITIIYSLAIGLSAAATAMVARRVGEKDKEGAAIAAAHVIYIGVFASLLLGILGACFAPNILSMMGATPEVIAEGVGYTRIMFATNFVIFFLFLLNAIFRGAGDANIAMKALIISNGINIVLDPCLILGLGPFPELGVTGAAVATSIGRGIGVMFQVYILIRGIGILKVMKRHFILAWDIVKRLLEVAAGGTGQYLIASASWIFMVKFVADFGTDAVAGYTIAVRIIIFAILPAWGMANAAATLVGQNLGANEFERAEKSAWRTSFFAMIFMVLITVLFFFVSDPVVQFFTTEPSVVKYAIVALQIMSLGYVFFAYGMILGASFNGAGDTKTPTIINFICFWLIQIPLAYFMAFYLEMDTNGIFWAIVISETILAIITIVWFKQGNWKKIDL